MDIEYFDKLENNREISLALIDSFYDLSTQKSDFFDLDLFEIQLVKYNIDLTPEIKNFFNKFISKDKNKKELDFFSYVLSSGVKNKYKNFNKQLKNLSYLYNIIVWIETHTEFRTLMYIDDVFGNEVESFYKFILFYVFKKENTEKIDEFSIKNIKKIINTKKILEDNFMILNLIFQNLKHTELIVKIFLSISKDKDFLKFISIQKKLSENDTIDKILKISSDNDYLSFILYVITFNPYIIIDEFKINIYNKDIRKFYIFLKAIIYRFEYYKLNQKSPQTLQLFFKYLFRNCSIDDLKKILYMIPNNETILFEPFITFALNYKDNDLQLSLLLKVIKSKTDNNNFMIVYGALNSLIKNLDSKELIERAINIFIGNFKNYLTSQDDFSSHELKNFFITINLFLIKIKLNNDTKEKLFKMNLKLFEKFIKKNYSINPTLLTISKYYNIILNTYLKEYNSPRNINLFLQEIEKIINDDNQVISLDVKNITEIDPETLSFNFISTEIKDYLTNDFNQKNTRLTIYQVMESEGVMIPTWYFNLLIILKITLVYDMLYPIFSKIYQSNTKIKKDKNNIYFFNKEEVLLSTNKIENINIKPKSFYYPYINKFYSIIIIIVFSFLGFRSIIDGVITNNNELMIFGSSIIMISLLIDYLLFFILKKFNKRYFFQIIINNKKQIFYSKDNSILNITNS